MGTRYGNTALPESTYTEDMNVGFNGNGHRSLKVHVHVTNLNADTPVVTPTIAIPDGNGGEIVILAGNAMSTVSSQTLTVGLEYTAAANSIAKDAVPVAGYVKMAHADAKPVDYTVAITLGN